MSNDLKDTLVMFAAVMFILFSVPALVILSTLASVKFGVMQ